VDRRRIPQVTSAGTSRERQFGCVETVPGGRHVGGGLEGRDRRRILDDERVVEVEQDRALHAENDRPPVRAIRVMPSGADCRMIERRAPGAAGSKHENGRQRWQSTP
jgi:hypothetical protein